MCYMRKDCDLEREDPKVIQARLLAEEARLRQEEHDRDRRRAKEAEKLLTEKVRR